MDVFINCGIVFLLSDSVLTIKGQMEYSDYIIEDTDVIYNETQCALYLDLGFLDWIPPGCDNITTSTSSSHKSTSDSILLYDEQRSTPNTLDYSSTHSSSSDSSDNTGAIIGAVIGSIVVLVLLVLVLIFYWRRRRRSCEDPLPPKARGTIRRSVVYEKEDLISSPV